MRKLSVKPDSGFYGWLEVELARRFDIACCATQKQFRREMRALTRSGQIKMAGEHHEKDDRHRLDDRSRYVLGWSNEAKIATLQVALARKQESRDELASRIDSTDRDYRQMEAQRRNLATLESEFAQFDELDWGASASKIQRLAEERDRLAAASDVLRQLNEQLERAEAALGKMEGRLEEAKEARAKTEQRRADARDLRASTEAEQRAARSPTETQSLALNAMCADALGQHRLTVESCDNRQQDVREWLQKRIDADEKRLSRLGEKIVRAMSEFKEEFKLATTEFDASIAAGPEYAAMLERLKADDLAQVRGAFQATPEREHHPRDSELPIAVGQTPRGNPRPHRPHQRLAGADRL